MALALLVGLEETQAQINSAYYNSLWRTYRYGYPYYSYYDPYYYYWDPWYYGYGSTTSTTTSTTTGPIRGPNQTPLTYTATSNQYAGTSAKDYLSGAPTKCILYSGSSGLGFTKAARVHEAVTSSSSGGMSQQDQLNLLGNQMQGQNNRGGTRWSVYGTQVIGADISYWQGLNPLYNTSTNTSSTGRGAAPDSGGDQGIQKETPSGVINYTPGPEGDSSDDATPSYTYSRFADPRRSLPAPRAAAPAQEVASASDDADSDAGKGSDTKSTSSAGGIVRQSAVKTIQASRVRTVQPTVSASRIRTVQPSALGARDFRSSRNRGK